MWKSLCENRKTNKCNVIENFPTFSLYKKLKDQFTVEREPQKTKKKRKIIKNYKKKNNQTIKIENSSLPLLLLAMHLLYIC